VTKATGKRTNRGFEGLAISPDGRHVFAMLQSAMLDEGGGDGVWARIVRFDYWTGRASAQFAYRLEGSSQGRGISALVALNEHVLLVLERNNRGIGVDANLTSPNKKVFRIDLQGASDVADIDLDAPGAVFTAANKQAAPWLDLATAPILADASLQALGGVSPEKWEGLAIGPRLRDGSYLVLAGTDNDYSVTQNASGTQRDVYFKPGAGTVSRIQCDIGTFANCLSVGTDGAAGAPVPADFDFSGYRVIPGVLHAYKASAADLAGYVRPWRWGWWGHGRIGTMAIGVATIATTATTTKATDRRVYGRYGTTLSCSAGSLRATIARAGSVALRLIASCGTPGGTKRKSPASLITDSVSPSP
jgi:hypothetical protein